MGRTSKGLLSIWLTLLLSLSPLQGAFADFSPQSEQGDSAHRMMAMDVAQDDHSSNHHGDHQCERCASADCCNGLGCVSGQCAGCAPMIGAVQIRLCDSASESLSARSFPLEIESFISLLFRPLRLPRP